MTQQHRNFTLISIITFLFIKTVGNSRKHMQVKLSVHAAVRKCSKPIFSKSSAREIEQDNRHETIHLPGPD